MPQTSSYSERELLQHLISEPLLISLWKTTEQLLGDKSYAKVEIGLQSQVESQTPALEFAGEHQTILFTLSRIKSKASFLKSALAALLDATAALPPLEVCFIHALEFPRSATVPP